MGNATLSDLEDVGAVPPEDFHDAIERVWEVAQHDLEVPEGLDERLQMECQDLLLAPEIARSAAAALRAGHLILQGPPGTGKTSLAHALARAFHVRLMVTTAHEAWTTYDVIGRQEIRLDRDGSEQIVPVNGFFTEAAVRCAGAIVSHFDDPGEPQATWLLIDELNRAHADRAFGELFSVLGTDALYGITLSHQRENNRELVTPRRFRIIGTVNSVDRQFVNSLGQGLKRRFTFVTVDVPDAADFGGNPATIGEKERLLVIRRASERVAQRQPDTARKDVPAKAAKLADYVASTAEEELGRLFTLVAQTRYAGENSDIPYLPVGTGHLIDTVELFIERSGLACSQLVDLADAMDWAVSVKMAPLFDTDTVTPDQLRLYADLVEKARFSQTKRELLRIVAAGQYYVSR